MREKTLAWHWLAEDRRLQFNTREVVQVGQTLKVDPPITLCLRGLHASVRALEALGYAPGPIVCRVEMGGEMVYSDDKLCATERTVLWMANATKTLHEFACWCAMTALERERKAGREPDIRCWNAIEVKLRWLRGEATDEELVAAKVAARVAASPVARVAAKVAARVAACAAAYDAAWDAACAAAWDAVYDAAYDAAWVAARAAAWDAAWNAQNTELERRLNLLQPVEGE